MSSFKKNIKESYASEVQPTYNEEAWKGFLAFQQEQNSKDRKPVFWWLWGLVGILSVLVISVIYSTWENLETPQKTELSSSSSNHAVVEAGTKALPKVNSSIPEDKADISEPSSFRKDLSPLNKKKERNSLSETPVSSKNVHLPGGQDNLSKDNHSQNPLPAQKAEDLPATTKPESKARSALTLPPFLDNLQLLSVPNKSFADLTPIKPVHHYRPARKVMLTLAIGAGSAEHRSIFNEQLQLIQAGIQIPIGHKLSVASHFAYHHLDFQSKVQNRALGIRSVPLPRSSLNLDRISSSTGYVEAGLGLLYRQRITQKWSITAGPAIRYIQEVSKALEYTFADQELNQENVTAAGSSLENHPFNLDLTTGLFYKTGSQIDIGFQVTYIRSLKTEKVILPEQWRYALAFQKAL